jgi:alpha-glucosidase
MPPRSRRLTPHEGLGSLAQFPLDGAGVQRVECFSAALAAKDVRALVFRPTLEGGARPGSSLTLAHTPQLTPHKLAEDAPLRAQFEADSSAVRAQIAFKEAASLYGGGPSAGGLLRNGRRSEFWNSDAWRYGESDAALYSSHPLALALFVDGSCAALIADSPRRGSLSFASDGLEFAFEGDPFDVWVLQAASLAQLFEGLTELIGRAELPPLWALGYQQSRWGYTNAEQLREIAAKLRSKRMPCDALWLDLDYMKEQRSFTWDSERFPEPEKLIAQLREQGLRVVTILDPGIAIAKRYPTHKSGAEGEHFVLDEHGRALVARVWPGACNFPDFTQESTRAWWAAQVEKFAECGVGGLWLDMCEPAVFRSPTRTLPLSARHRGLGGGDHAKFHNLYGQLAAQATREGLLDARPEERPFVLARASHLSGARFAAQWTGDNQATWDDLRWSLSMTLALGLVGQPFAGADVGGFEGDPSPELFARWFELGAFLPFFRGHSHKDSCRKEPWSFGGETDRAVKLALERRMQFLPTLYTLFEEAHRTGLPIVRPMFFADPSDRALRDIDDQFLLGPDLIVAPVLEEGARKRTVVLPAAGAEGWYLYPTDLEGHSKDLLPPGRYAVDAPLGQTPLFARAGRIIVNKPSKLHTGAQADEEPVLHVFFDSAMRATGQLYEDDGISRNAEGRLTTLSARILRGRVVIDAFVDGEEVLDRAWRVIAHGMKTPAKA